jgi:hypothetical protein
MAVPNHKSTVETVRKTYPAKPTKNQCVDLCNEVAWIHRGEGFGIAEKTSGTYGIRSDGQRASIDGLVYRPPAGGTEQFIDILGNAEGENPPFAVPQWTEHSTSNRRWVKPIQPQGSTQPPIPPPEPPPSGDYVTEADFALYKREVDHKIAALRDELTAMITGVSMRVDRLEDRVVLLETGGVPPASVQYVLIADEAAPAIPTSREWGHGHELRASVVVKP